MATHYVYIAASRARNLYVGVPNDLVRRMYEHNHGVSRGFTAQYHLPRLVVFEQTENFRAAIWREKRIKGWVRARKLELIERENRPGTISARDGFERQILRFAQNDRRGVGTGPRMARGAGFFAALRMTILHGDAPCPTRYHRETPPSR